MVVEIHMFCFKNVFFSIMYFKNVLTVNLYKSLHDFDDIEVDLGMSWVYQCHQETNDYPLIDGQQHEKTCLQGFPQSMTQTSFLSYRD